VACFATSAASKKYFSNCFHSVSEKVFIVIFVGNKNIFCRQPPLAYGETTPPVRGEISSLIGEGDSRLSGGGEVFT